MKRYRFREILKIVSLRKELSISNKLFNIVIDVDGVLTDGTFHYSKLGKEVKVFGPHDADALKLLQKRFHINVISADARGFAITEKRIHDMGFSVRLMNADERQHFVKSLKQNGKVIFIADSFTDVPAFEESDYSFAPQNACISARKAVDVVLKINGGFGVIAELVRLLKLEHL
jgi:3-deoxy-D-manno-octulosonate 8-phosphate phosphatase (KDO 8-P phosphatase)